MSDKWEEVLRKVLESQEGEILHCAENEDGEMEIIPDPDITSIQ